MPAPSAKERSARERSERLYARLQRDLEREQGAAAWLRSRRTSSRVVLIGLAALAACAAVALLIAGPTQLAETSALRWLSLVSLTALSGVAITAALRPLHRPAWSGRSGQLLVAGVGMAAVASIAVSGDGSLGALSSGRCLMISAGVGAPIFALVLLFDRRPRRLGVFRAIFGGLVGLLAVQLVCPAPGLAHLMVEHLGVALASTAVFLGVGAALAR